MATGTAAYERALQRLTGSTLKQCARCGQRIMPRDEHYTPFDWQLVFCTSRCIEMWQAHAQARVC